MKKKISFLCICIIFITAGSIHGQRDTPVLIAHYPFSGDASDISGSKYHGIVHGPVIGLDRFGNQGYAYEFDGIDDYIQLPLNINPDVLPVCTITMWVKSDSAGPQATVLSHDDGGFDRTIGIDDREKGVTWSAFSGSGTVLGRYPVTDEWTFLAVVYNQLYNNGNLQNGLVKLYVNDSLYQEPGLMGQGLKYVHIGANPSSGEFFRGTIDDIRIYKGELTERNIGALQNASNPLPGPEIQWTKTYGDISDTEGFAVYENINGGFTVLCSKEQVYFIDNKGDYISNLSYAGGLEVFNRSISGYLGSPAWGFLVLGYSENNRPAQPDAVIKKINTIGQLNWGQKYEKYSWFNDIEPTGLGEYALIGKKFDSIYSYDSYSDTLSFIKIKSDGTVLLEVDYLGIRAASSGKIRLSQDNGFIIIASKHADRYDSRTDLLLLKTDNNGNVIWTRTYGREDENELGMSVFQTSDGGFLMFLQTSWQLSGTGNSYLYHVDHQGQFLWQKNYLGNYHTFKKTKSGNYIMLGNISAPRVLFGNGGIDILVTLVDSTGTTLWSKTIGGELDDLGRDIYETADGGFIIAGSSNSFSGEHTEIFLSRIAAPDVSALPLEQDVIPSGFELLQNYPNPFNPETTIKYSLAEATKVRIDVYNLLGQHITTLLNTDRPAGYHNVVFNAENLSSGVYFYSIRAGEYVGVKKMIHVK